MLHFFPSEEWLSKMSHKRKHFDALAKGKYSWQTLRDIVRDVLNGRTNPQKAYKDHGIPVRTIQHHVKCVLVYCTHS